MTKDEIKKALECCEKYAYCKDCPCYTYCEHELHKGALALITEQEKEIERLNEVIRNYKEVLCETTQRKDDAIKLNDKLVDEYENKIKQAQIDVLNKLGRIAWQGYQNGFNRFEIIGILEDMKAKVVFDRAQEVSKILDKNIKKYNRLNKLQQEVKDAKDKG